MATLLNVQTNEIILTSGATESNNIAILGLMRHGLDTGRRHILASSIEHHSVLEPLERLRESGFDIDYLPVTTTGYVEPTEVRRRLRSDTLLVSVMPANNETGVLRPVEEIAELVEKTPTLFMIDAAQAFGKEVITLRNLQYDHLSISSHKIYGPKGVGVLCARRLKGRRLPRSPILFGGGQEMGFRPGTLPVSLIVGLGGAAAIAGVEHESRREAASRVKNRLLEDLRKVEFLINGDVSLSQAHIVNGSFPRVHSEALMMSLRNELAFSNRATCTTASYQPSHVLKAMGLSDDPISSTVRLSWGRGVDHIPAEAIVRAVQSLQ